MSRILIDGSGHYEISDIGEVYNAKYSRFLKGGLGTNGRPHVALPVGAGRFVTCEIHVLVCTAFHGPRPEGTEASHIDGNILNNCASNLIWETRSQNLARRGAHGTSDKGFGNSRASVDAADVRDIKERFAGGESQKSIAAKYHLHLRTIGRILTGKRFA